MFSQMSRSRRRLAISVAWLFVGTSVLVPPLAGAQPRLDWAAFNDLNGIGGGNAANVTVYSYQSSGMALRDFETGAALPVTMSGAVVGGYDPTSNGVWFAPGTDGFNTFDGIVGLQGSYELDGADWEHTLTFDGLDPNKTYAITLTGNRGEERYENARFTRVSIVGADAFANESSDGVIVYSEDEVSFGTGFNFENGYVARWAGITAADGRFSVVSKWDPDGGSGFANTKGYAMSVFKLEQLTNAPETCTEDADCDDGNVCTTDSCDPGTGECGSAFNTNPCDDGASCTDGDACQEGACVGIDACVDGQTCSLDRDRCEGGEGVAFSAYNDLAWAAGQRSQNLTTITSPNGGSGLPSTGELIDHDTGIGTGIFLAIDGGIFNGGGHAFDGGDPPAGSDAFDVFDGIVTTRGAVSYLGGPGSSLVLTLTNLDPGQRYTVVFHGDRAAYGWDRASRVTLAGADAFINDSSVAQDNPAPGSGGALFRGPDDPSTRLPAANSNGYVARFTEVDAGADGTIALTVQADGAGGIRGKYASALMLQGVGEIGPECNGPTDCDDADVCTDDLCEQGRCQHVSNNAACDDGIGCTAADACVEGECIGTDACPEDERCDAELQACTSDERPSWVAYNDVYAVAGTGPNVTTYGFAVQNGALVNHTSGEILGPRVSGEAVAGYDPTTNGINCAPGTDAAVAFGGVVDLAGIYELDTPPAQNRFVFDGLDPDAAYAITLTANRGNPRYGGARFTRVTLEGADSYVNDSSAGVVIIDESSVSFSTGDNTVNGYVARWTNIRSANGTFSVVSAWDPLNGAGGSNTKGYAMAAFMLEEQGAVGPGPDLFAQITAPADGTVVHEPTTLTGRAGGPAFVAWQLAIVARIQGWEDELRNPVNVIATGAAPANDEALYEILPDDWPGGDYVAGLGVIGAAGEAWDTVDFSIAACGGEEICNGVDDNCNNEIDEGFGVGSGCAVGAGACTRNGVLVCSPDAQASLCSAQPGPPDLDLCDGIDNDCDDEIDEDYNVGEPCVVGAGECQAVGVMVCQPDGEGSECSAQPGGGVAEICNGVDDDCDDEIDEGYDVGAPCSAGVGECRADGLMVCNPDGPGTICGAQPGEPGFESCGDGLDNDCDGEVDDGCGVGLVAEFTHPDNDTVIRQPTTLRGTAGGPTFLRWELSIVRKVAGWEDALIEPESIVNAGPFLRNGDTLYGIVPVQWFDGDYVAGLHVFGSNGDIWATLNFTIPACEVQEICNGVDDNCDGQIDDGYDAGASCTVGIGECGQTGLLVCTPDGQGTTCDAEAGLPEAEICDGRDNDCDDEIDEGFDVAQACSMGEGECRTDGTRICNPAGDGTVCGAEPGLAAPELCDGLDNDCDGETDEAFDTLGQPCAVGTGECRAVGVQICSPAGDVAVCDVQAGPPVAEQCDGLDNDCDGEIDENFSVGQPCSVGRGECRNDGSLICNPAGDGVVCSVQPGEIIAELCDGLDNDCDGDIDEGFALGEICTVGLGECRVGGLTICGADGSGTVCDAEPGPSRPEVCDGQDNDCDDEIDEDFDDLDQVCAVGTGQCQADGVRVCNPAGDATECDAVPGAAAPELCDGLDNDCDDEIDEDYNLGDGCTAGVGECERPGALVCNPQGDGTRCDAAPGASVDEICNGRDDNCDGEIDEGYQTGLPCSAGQGECATDGVFQCNPAGDGVECSAEAGAAGAEICDGLDNDCDDEIDEGFAIGEACTVGLGACETSGLTICNAPGDATVCGAEPGLSVPEVCDGLDNDCDGGIDEDFGQLGQVCVEGQGECQAQGVHVCNPAGDGTACDADLGAAFVELCNGLDDDCDGEFDEDFALGDVCTVGLGQCESSGVWVCDAQSVGAICDAEPGASQVEACNGLDDDCDGETDEGYDVGLPCSVGTGECQAHGAIECDVLGDGDTMCSADGGPPKPELCDGLDNNCDGEIDEPFSLGDACTVGLGQCEAAGVFVCDGAHMEAICDAEPGVAIDEQCANGLDDDCDGEVDEVDCVQDSDGDGSADHVDNCPTVANVDQADAEGDGIGDLCDRYPSCFAQFEGLGDLTGGGPGSQARAVSFDGSVVVGTSLSAASSPYTEAFRWTDGDGMVGLGTIGGGLGYASAAHGVSANGSVVVGFSLSAASCWAADICYTEAFRWTEADGMVGLGDLAEDRFQSEALAVSADGNVVVGVGCSGFCDPIDLTEGFWWSARTGMVPLDGQLFTVSANDVVAGGDVVVGSHTTDGLDRHGFLFVRGSGMYDLDPDLSDLNVTGASGDGFVTVGVHTTDDNDRRAFIRVEGEGFVDLGLDNLIANGVSTDGRVVALTRFEGGPDSRAHVFDMATLESRDVNHLLTDRCGVDLEDWTLVATLAVSGDGRTLVGDGTRADGRYEAWRARIFEVPVDLGEHDADGDGVPDAVDVCPDEFDPQQADNDGDGQGDLCDDDDDNDTALDVDDNCPFDANPGQFDTDQDGMGDVCDVDACFDGIVNGNESDFDCGGDLCMPCFSGLLCGQAADCVNGICEDGLCGLSTCDDGVSNGLETGVDCGGQMCPLCGAGQGCSANGDCLSNYCTDSDGRVQCQPIVCGDGRLGGDEICDHGPANSDVVADACRTDCTLPRCGDAVVDMNEICDDGNGVNGDGCQNDCTFQPIHCGSLNVFADGLLPTWQATGYVIVNTDDGSIFDGTGMIVAPSIAQGISSNPGVKIIVQEGMAGDFSPPDIVAFDFDEVGIPESAYVYVSGSRGVAFLTRGRMLMFGTIDASGTWGGGVSGAGPAGPGGWLGGGVTDGCAPGAGAGDGPGGGVPPLCGGDGGSGIVGINGGGGGGGGGACGGGGGAGATFATLGQPGAMSSIGWDGESGEPGIGTGGDRGAACTDPTVGGLANPAIYGDAQMSVLFGGSGGTAGSYGGIAGEGGLGSRSGDGGTVGQGGSPGTIGSGGGGGGGGGVVALCASGLMVIDGLITTDGGSGGSGWGSVASVYGSSAFWSGDCEATALGGGGGAGRSGPGGGGGGGAGGSVYLRGPTVSITGTIQSLGGLGGIQGFAGTGASYGFGACGGGRGGSGGEAGDAADGGAGSDGRIRIEAVTSELIGDVKGVVSVGGLF